MLDMLVKSLISKGILVSWKVPAVQPYVSCWATSWVLFNFAFLGVSERDTATRLDQDSCHTSQDAESFSCGPNRSGSDSRALSWLLTSAGTLHFSRIRISGRPTTEDYRGRRSIGLAMMVFDCSASAATCVKFISIRSSDFLVLYLACFKMCLSHCS